MKIEAIVDARTRRVESLTLAPATFAEERAITLLHDALTGGRKITVDTNDEVDYEFSVELTSQVIEEME